MKDDLATLLGRVALLDVDGARRCASTILADERASGGASGGGLKEMLGVASTHHQGWTALHFVCAMGGGWSSASTKESGTSRAQDLPSPTSISLATGFLVDAGFSLEAESTQLRHTALHIAASVGAIGCASELLSRGARLQATDEFGHTALHLAAAAGFRGVLELLLDAILERQTLEFATAQDKQGQTPLGVAQAAGNQKCAEVLQRFLSRHLTGSTVSQEEVAALTLWLESEVKLPAYIDGFISLGYTRLDLWAEIGLSAEDYDQIGVKAPAHRRQINHYLKKYADDRKESSDEIDSSDEEDSDDSGSDASDSE